MSRPSAGTKRKGVPKSDTQQSNQKRSRPEEASEPQDNEEEQQEEEKSYPKKTNYFAPNKKKWDPNVPVKKRNTYVRAGSFFPSPDILAEDLVKNIDRVHVDGHFTNKSDRMRQRMFVNDNVSSNRPINIEIKAFTQYGVRLDTKDNNSNKKVEQPPKQITDKDAKFNISFLGSENPSLDETSIALRTRTQVCIEAHREAKVYANRLEYSDITTFNVKPIVRLPDAKKEKSVPKLMLNLNPEFTELTVLDMARPHELLEPISWNEFAGITDSKRFPGGLLGQPGEYIITFSVAHLDLKPTSPILSLSPIVYLQSLTFIKTIPVPQLSRLLKYLPPPQATSESDTNGTASLPSSSVPDAHSTPSVPTTSGQTAPSAPSGPTASDSPNEPSSQLTDSTISTDETQTPSKEESNNSEITFQQAD